MRQAPKRVVRLTFWGARGYSRSPGVPPFLIDAPLAPDQRCEQPRVRKSGWDKAICGSWEFKLQILLVLSVPMPRHHVQCLVSSRRCSSSGCVVHCTMRIPSCPSAGIPRRDRLYVSFLNYSKSGLQMPTVAGPSCLVLGRRLSRLRTFNGYCTHQ